MALSKGRSFKHIGPQFWALINIGTYNIQCAPIDVLNNFVVVATANQNTHITQYTHNIQLKYFVPTINDELGLRRETSHSPRNFQKILMCTSMLPIT